MTKFITLVLVSVFLISNTAFAKTSKTLTEQLREKADLAKAKAPLEKRKIMEGAIEDLRKSNIIKTALKKGDSLPSFSLPDVTRGMTHSKELLKKGPLIVVFYRGGWCPYCNLQLHDLQKHLSKIQALGAQLVAISPQSPDSSLSTAKKAQLKFYVLSDRGSQVARKFGLVFQLPDNLKNLYQEFGIDLEKSNQSNKWELPLSATYIASPTGKILYSFLDADYKKRAETLDLIQILQKQRRSP